MSVNTSQQNNPCNKTENFKMKTALL